MFDYRIDWDEKVGPVRALTRPHARPTAAPPVDDGTGGGALGSGHLSRP